MAKNKHGYSFTISRHSVKKGGICFVAYYSCECFFLLLENVLGEKKYGYFMSFHNI